MMSFAERMLQEARLVMLQELGRQVNGRLPIRSLEGALEVEGHNHDADWIMSQLAWLEVQGLVRRIRVADAGDYKIVQLTPLGESFLARKIEVRGVKRPEFDTGL